MISPQSAVGKMDALSECEISDSLFISVLSFPKHQT